MGANYKAKKRDFERKLRQRRAAELANGGELGTVSLPPIRRNIRGILQCEERPAEGTKVLVGFQNDEVVALRDNALLVKIDKSKVNKATLARLQKASFTIGEVRRPHQYLPIVDISVQFERPAKPANQNSDTEAE
ncbi:MAG: hypothetical protein ACT4O6_20185 [Reyranella sp.]